MLPRELTDQALTVFIGYDSREPQSFQVCADSIRKHTSVPVRIAALKQDKLRERGIYLRSEKEEFSTEFAMTRFLVPYLCQFEGYALFVDCDFLFTRDIAEMLAHVTPFKAVSVVKQDYTPRASFKMDGQPQVNYPRKNWSSLMFFNNSACLFLTRFMVNSQSPAYLHQFKWLHDDYIGELPQEWNWLEGDMDWPHDGTVPAGIHFTNGTPEICPGADIRFGDLWKDAVR